MCCIGVCTLFGSAVNGPVGGAAALGLALVDEHIENNKQYFSKLPLVAPFLITKHILQNAINKIAVYNKENEKLQDKGADLNAIIKKDSKLISLMQAEKYIKYDLKDD